MRIVAKYFALLMLIVLITPSIMYLAGKMTLPTAKNIMLAATALWFMAAGFWMWHEEKPPA
jgi:hypothetical protein